MIGRGLFFASFLLLAAPVRADEVREIAVTFDDLPVAGPPLSLSRGTQMTEKLLAGLRKNGIPAVAFVNEKKLYVTGETDGRIGLLTRWLEAGHELGNHTFSHPSLHATPLPAFEEEVVRGETVTRLLLDARGRKLRWFRHPFLQTGPSLAARSQFEAFLRRRGYTVAPVSIDNSDWMFAAVYADAKTKGDAVLMEKLRAAYLDYLPAMMALIPPDGHTVFDVMSNMGYCFHLAGENIGWNNYPDDQSTSQIQTMFMNSPDHRQNILGPAWDVMGIGAYKGPDGKKMWAVVFADRCGSVAPKPTPKPVKPKPPVKPAPTKPKPPPIASPRPTPSPTPSAAPTTTDKPTPSLDPGSSPIPSGEVALAAGGSLRISDPPPSQGLFDSIAAGIAGLFFGN